LPKSQPCTPSVRSTQYSAASGTASQDTVALRTPAVAVTTGRAVGAGVPMQPWLSGRGAAQAMPWRRKASLIATMCGVPLAITPSSSSAASMFMYQLSALHPPTLTSHW
jgi:hypothetical protein